MSTKTKPLVSEARRVRRMSPAQVRHLLDLMERGLAGEFDRINIDFRGSAFYIDALRKTKGTTRFDVSEGRNPCTVGR